jgi:hypothetical protein
VQLDPDRPRQLAYHEGEAVPPGYHVETKPRTGLLIAGGILSGIALTIVVAYAGSSHHSSDDDLGIALATTLFAAPGIPLFIVGLASLGRQVLIRDDDARWFVGPQLARGGAGLTGGFAF